MADAEIKLVISADNADAIKKVQEFAKSLDGVSVSTDKTKKSQEDLATSVFKGTAAWDILKTGLKEVEGFVVDSAKAFIEAENKMSLVKNTVESLGVAYDSVKPQIEEFSQKMSRLGVDDEQAALSMVKLAKAAGGDFAKGMQLAKLASDLTASGIGDLESNTDNLQKILIGKGARALLEYKINLDDTATTAEQLNAVQKKVTRTTEEYADTTEGKVKIMQEAFENLKEEIGQGFILAIQDAISAGKGLNNTLDTITESGKMGRAVIFSLTNVLVGVGQASVAFAKTVASPIAALEMLWIRVKEGKEAAAAFKEEYTNGINKSLEGFGHAMNNAINPIDGMTKAQQELEAQSKQTGNTADLVGDKVKNANKLSAEEVEKHKKAVQDLKDKYNEATAKIADDLSSLEASHKEKLDSITDSIAKVKQSLKDLEESYNRNKTDDTQSVADQIVASEKKVAELQKEINAETSDDRRASLQQDLAEEQKNLASASQWKIDNTVAITEAERRAGLTDLQRTIEDYSKKRILAEQDYQEKKTRLEQELTDLDEKNKKEIQMYTDKVGKITEQLNKETATFKKNMAEQTVSAVSNVNTQIDAYNRLAAAKSKAGVSSGAISNNSNIDSSGMALQAPGGMPHFAEGGIVNGPTVALVGEEGPEAIIPLSKMKKTGGATINININGAIFSHDAAEKLGDMIIQKLRMNMRI